MVLAFWVWCIILGLTEPVRWQEEVVPVGSGYGICVTAHLAPGYWIYSQHQGSLQAVQFAVWMEGQWIKEVYDEVDIVSWVNNLGVQDGKIYNEWRFFKIVSPGELSLPRRVSYAVCGEGGCLERRILLFSQSGPKN